MFNIATLDLEERLILEDGPRRLIKSDLTDDPPTQHPHADGLFRSNHWLDIIKILNLHLGDQNKVFKYLKWRRPHVEEDL
jgi:hypothetical protein